MSPRYESVFMTHPAACGIGIAFGIILFVIALIAIVVSNIEPPPPPKYEVGEVLILRLTRDPVIVVENDCYGERAYRCKTTDKSENKLELYKTAQFYEAELERITEVTDE